MASEITLQTLLQAIADEGKPYSEWIYLPLESAHVLLTLNGLILASCLPTGIYSRYRLGYDSNTLNKMTTEDKKEYLEVHLMSERYPESSEAVRSYDLIRLFMEDKSLLAYTQWMVRGEYYWFLRTLDGYTLAYIMEDLDGTFRLSIDFEFHLQHTGSIDYLETTEVFNTLEKAKARAIQYLSGQSS